ncbi:response regulator transcription factor [Pontibacterium granulatum]|uniref:response regulator n=1 Tax=Pontibacterium granulatum TaxID=2036029 RepID=UPI00249CDBE1|nr:response regulator transcription factor [Pontibacterium granulatum]MDI3325840.1 response regulator transcription factor [Pontibacterium granulatum]
MVDGIGVLLVDDHPLVRAGFHRLLQADGRISIVAEANNGQEAFDLYQEHSPDVVIMDLSMPTDTSDPEATTNINGGLDAIRRIISYDASARVLVLTVMESDPFPSHVLNAGAKGYLTKRCAPEELLEAVVTIYRGGSYISEFIKAKLGTGADDEASPVGTLTKRELQIFTHLANGQSVAQVAEQMFLSPKTIHAHRTNILRKLKVSNNSELVHLAIRHGIVQA